MQKMVFFPVFQNKLKRLKKVVPPQDSVIIPKIPFASAHYSQFKMNENINANLPSAFPFKEILIQTLLRLMRSAGVVFLNGLFPYTLPKTARALYL